MTSPFVKWSLRAALIPAAVLGYIAVAGVTGFCPNCADIVGRVAGRANSSISPGEPRGSIEKLIVYDLDGQPVSLATYLGKPTIIDVWATWCPPCRKQRGVIHDLDPEFLKTVNIVSLSTDKTPQIVREYIAKSPSNIVDLMYSSEALRAFGGVSSIPTLVFVDPNGQIRDVSTGVHSATELKRRVQGLALAK